MLNKYIENGLTQTIIHDNNTKKDLIDSVKWDSEFDGNIANISISSNSNGNKKKLNLKLDKQDLDNLLNIPSMNNPLDKRLSLNNETPFLIELPNIQPREELLIPLTLKKRKYRRHKYKRRTSSKSKIRTSSRTSSKSKRRTTSRTSSKSKRRTSSNKPYSF